MTKKIIKINKKSSARCLKRNIEYYYNEGDNIYNIRSKSSE